MMERELVSEMLLGSTTWCGIHHISINACWKTCPSDFYTKILLLLLYIYKYFSEHTVFTLSLCLTAQEKFLTHTVQHTIYTCDGTSTSF